MPPKKKKEDVEKELAKEVKALSKEIRKLKDLEFIRIFKHPFKFMWFSLLKGLMIGFGSVLGASVLVALFVFLIAKISFVPIIGDFIEEIMGQIELTQTETAPVQEKSFVEQYNETKENMGEEKEEEQPLEEPPPSV